GIAASRANYLLGAVLNNNTLANMKEAMKQSAIRRGALLPHTLGDFIQLCSNSYHGKRFDLSDTAQQRLARMMGQANVGGASWWMSGGGRLGSAARNAGQGLSELAGRLGASDETQESIANAGDTVAGAIAYVGGGPVSREMTRQFGEMSSRSAQ